MRKEANTAAGEIVIRRDVVARTLRLRMCSQSTSMLTLN